MTLTVLDTRFKAISVIDIYESLIWTDRYCGYGDFELSASMTDTIFDCIKLGYYLLNSDSEHVMIIETIRISSDSENGNHMIVTGRSLESILDRRIVWGQQTITGNLQNGIMSLLDKNVIEPINRYRKILNFTFSETDDPVITSLEINAQYTGDNLYDIISKICNERNIGFKITLNGDNQFVFKLYAGTNRSYGQSINPYVIFSPKFDNIINSNYMESNSALKNVTLVGGEGESSARRYATVGEVPEWVPDGSDWSWAMGLDRRELFTDARDISSDIGDGVILVDWEYMYLLEQRGKEKLAENTEIISFEGRMETTTMFRYGRDFFNGDIVQIVDEYGHREKARVVEIVMSEDEDGNSIYPTFKTIE